MQAQKSKKMKIELTRKITDGDHSGYSSITQEFTELEYKHFLKYGAHDYIEKSIVDGKKVEKLLYKVLEEDKKDEYEYTREQMLEMAKEMELQFAKNISTKKLYELINK